MRTASTATGALALALALTLAGCSDDSPAPADASASAMGSAVAKDPTASESAMTDDAKADDAKADESMESDESMEEDSQAMASEGAWIDRAAYEADPAKYHAAGDVVLFFNASWCPTCRTTVQSLDRDGTPAGLTVVSVDYDNSSDLRSTYGVTVQHTFVQVDGSGNELAKFTGSASGADIAAKTV